MNSIHPTPPSSLRLTGTIALALTLIQTMTSFGVEGQWTAGTPMPTARFFHSAEVVDGRIYAIGGALASRTLTGVNEVYGPATATWTTKAPMPTPRSGAGSAMVNGKIYMIGGVLSQDSGTLRVVEEYDPATDTWTTKAPMPTSRTGPGIFVVDGKIHVISGWRGTGHGEFPNIIEVYDPQTDTWEQPGTTPISARGFFAVSVADGRMYQFGGTRSGGTGGRETTEFDPGANTWTPKAPMPRRRHLLSASTLNGKIYAMGGNDAFTPALSTVQVYDPQTDTWESGPAMPLARGSFETVTLNGKIYAFGGLTGFPWGDRGTVYASMDVYTPSSPELEAISRTAAGTTVITLPEGETYDIEYSPDLKSDSWIVLQRGVSGSYEDTDPVRTASSRGFYRGVFP